MISKLYLTFYAHPYDIFGISEQLSMAENNPGDV